MQGGAFSRGLLPRPYPERQQLGVSHFFMGPPTYAHTVWETATKFCMAIKLNKRKIFTGQPHPLPWPKFVWHEWDAEPLQPAVQIIVGNNP